MQHINPMNELIQKTNLHNICKHDQSNIFSTLIQVCSSNSNRELLVCFLDLFSY